MATEQNKTLKDSIAELVEKEKNKKHFINPVYKEKLERSFVWLFIIAVLIGGFFGISQIYIYGGIISVFQIVFIGGSYSIFMTFHNDWSKRQMLIYLLVNILFIIASTYYWYFCTTPEEIFSRAIEQINKINQ